MAKERIDVQQHFVTFYSPGTFFQESSSEPIESWDVDEALRRATKIVERHGARPYAFRFSTRGRTANDLDSKVIKSSPLHFFGINVRTQADVIRDNLPNEQILRDNMRINKVARIAAAREGWKTAIPIDDEDIVLDDERVAAARRVVPAQPRSDGDTHG